MKTRSSSRENARKRFRLHEHPWLALLASTAVGIFAIFLTGAIIFGGLGLPDDRPIVQFSQATAFHFLTVFILVPFLLRLPKGKTTYGQYLADIGLTRIQPFFKLVLLALSCSLILGFCQASASIIYRLFEGYPVTWGFIRQVFDLSGDLPPNSAGLLVTVPSMFEEFVNRGVILTTFRNKYTAWKAIIFSSLGFGLIHLLNLAMGRELIWVLGQVVWAFLIGLFYGYVFVRTGSLLPSMIVHYFGNAFIGSLTAYIQARAGVEIEVIYGIVLTLGLVPTALMILWANFFINRWIPGATRLAAAGPRPE